MMAYGIDFTSAPKKSKPLTVAKCSLDGGVLTLNAVECFTGFEGFEDLLASDGPWIAGLDFPFGQSRELITILGWPAHWPDYVELVGSLNKEEYESLLRSQPDGKKRLFRRIDRKANSRSPMQLDFIPVGKMFYQGAPRLLRSGASILPNHPTDSDRLIVEAYPALVARKFIGKASYKNDKKAKQTPERAKSRQQIVEGLCSTRLKDIYGFSLELDEATATHMIEDAGADLLDALLCAIQAAWAWGQKDNNYGIPEDCDPVEGWIVDPEMSEG